jgi:hypothetical protein
MSIGRFEISPWILTATLVASGCSAPTAPTNDGATVDRDGGASADGGEDAALCRGARAEVGGQCRCQADCVAGAVCVTERETGGPGGSCAMRCDPSQPPPQGYVCRSTATDVALLFRTCGANEPCAPSRACQLLMGRTTCTPFCTEDADCDSGHCERLSGTCVERATTPAGAAVGDACTRDQDCAGEVCLPGTDFPGGYCSALCDARAGACAGDGFCFVTTMAAAAGANIGLCLKTCTTVADCRAGYRCIRAGGGRSVCFAL